MVLGRRFKLYFNLCVWNIEMLPPFTTPGGTPRANGVSAFSSAPNVRKISTASAAAPVAAVAAPPVPVIIKSQQLYNIPKNLLNDPPPDPPSLKRSNGEIISHGKSSVKQNTGSVKQNKGGRRKHKSRRNKKQRKYRTRKH